MLEPKALAHKALNLSRVFFDKIRYSKSLFIYLGAFIFSLGLARITNSVLLYAFSEIKPGGKAQRKAMVRKKNAASTIVNPGEIIGGAIYKAPAQTTQATGGNTAAPGADFVQFELLGTLEGDPSFATAVVRVKGSKTGQSQEYRTWQKIGSTRITYIGREYIWVRQSGQKMKIKVGETNQQETVAPASNKSSGKITPSKITGGRTIVKVLSRAEVNKDILGNPAKIYQGASFGPKLKAGKIIGYKIHKVKPNHIFYKLGARSGDIIRKVNGFPLSDTERMFELWKSMKSTSRVKVDIERGGQLITYDFHVRN